MAIFLDGPWLAGCPLDCPSFIPKVCFHSGKAKLSCHPQDSEKFMPVPRGFAV